MADTMVDATAAPFDLVIFDCDGVLVDSERISNAVLVEMLGTLGLRLTIEDALRDFVGRSSAACVAIFEQRLGRALPPGFVDDLRARSAEALARDVRPVEGVEEALDRITLPCCVASSGEHEKMRLTLGRTGLLRRFEGRLFSATEVARGKPWPDVFLHAASRMGASPARTAVVEDSPVGVRAAVAAGMTVYGYSGLGDPASLAAAGARVFDDMRALPDLLLGAPTP